jgi:hypothetical protein
MVSGCKVADTDQDFRGIWERPHGPIYNQVSATMSQKLRNM